MSDKPQSHFQSSFPQTYEQDITTVEAHAMSQLAREECDVSLEIDAGHHLLLNAEAVADSDITLGEVSVGNVIDSIRNAGTVFSGMGFPTEYSSDPTSGVNIGLKHEVQQQDNLIKQTVADGNTTIAMCDGDTYSIIEEYGEDLPRSLSLYRTVGLLALVGTISAGVAQQVYSKMKENDFESRKMSRREFLVKGGILALGLGTVYLFDKYLGWLEWMSTTHREDRGLYQEADAQFQETFEELTSDPIYLTYQEGQIELRDSVLALNARHALNKYEEKEGYPIQAYMYYGNGHLGCGNRLIEETDEIEERVERYAERLVYDTLDFLVESIPGDVVIDYGIGDPVVKHGEDQVLDTIYSYTSLFAEEHEIGGEGGDIVERVDIATHDIPRTAHAVLIDTIDKRIGELAEMALETDDTTYYTLLRLREKLIDQVANHIDTLVGAVVSARETPIELQIITDEEVQTQYVSGGSSFTKMQYIIREEDIDSRVKMLGFGSPNINTHTMVIGSMRNRSRECPVVRRFTETEEGLVMQDLLLIGNRRAIELSSIELMQLVDGDYSTSASQGRCVTVLTESENGGVLIPKVYPSGVELPKTMKPVKTYIMPSGKSDTVFGQDTITIYEFQETT